MYVNYLSSPKQYLVASRDPITHSFCPSTMGKDNNGIFYQSRYSIK